MAESLERNWAEWSAEKSAVQKGFCSVVGMELARAGLWATSRAENWVSPRAGLTESKKASLTVEPLAAA
jgi:hypothetical protein